MSENKEKTYKSLTSGRYYKIFEQNHSSSSERYGYYPASEDVDSIYADAAPDLKTVKSNIEWMEQADEIEKSKWRKQEESN